MSPEDSKAYPRESAGPVFQLFVSIFDLPGEEFEPLARALEKVILTSCGYRSTKFRPFLLPLRKRNLPRSCSCSARPYFLALRETFPLDGSQWEDGRCPLCSARPALASILEGPKRLLHCSFCGTSGPSPRFIGCPNCGTTDAAKLNTIMSEDEPGFRIATCDECQTYVKIVESQVLNEMGVDLADLASLPLDIVAQEKGYVRMAPNPIGLKKME